MIGGNTVAEIQRKTTTSNDIGEPVESWVTAGRLTGWLDLTVSENATTYTRYHAKIQESTHIFVCDYFPLGDLAGENSRVVIGGKIYDVQLVDDPMGMHRQLEIYLKYTGGQ